MPKFAERALALVGLLCVCLLALPGPGAARSLGKAPGWSAFHQKPVCRPPPRSNSTLGTFSHSNQIKHKFGNLSVIVFLQSSEFSCLQVAARVERLDNTLRTQQSPLFVDFAVVNGKEWQARASTFALRWATKLPVYQATASADIFADYDAKTHDAVVLDRCGYVVYKVSVKELADVERKLKPAITRVAEASPCRHCYSSGS